MDAIREILSTMSVDEKRRLAKKLLLERRGTAPDGAPRGDHAARGDQRSVPEAAQQSGTRGRTGPTPGGAQPYTLPNGLSVLHLNRYETDLVYREVFVDQVYLRHGITVNEGDCILDVGANIGLFSLFLQETYRDVTVYAFEPSVELYQILCANTAPHASRVHALRYGISDSDREAVFTFYPKYSILSGFRTDLERDKALIRARARALLSEVDPQQGELVDGCIDSLIEEKLRQRVEYACPLRTLSSVLDECRIARVDLLKIDAEGSELGILEGIEEDDWEKIRQVVMEVHDPEGPMLDRIVRLLGQKGYRLEGGPETSFGRSGLSTVYARRPATAASPARAVGRRAGDHREEGEDRQQNDEKLVISATFTAEPLRAGLDFWISELEWPVQAEFAPFNQVFQELLKPDSRFHANRAGMNVILLRVDDWVRYQQERLHGPQAGTPEKDAADDQRENLRAIADDFLNALRAYRDRAPAFTLLILCPIPETERANPRWGSVLAEVERRLIESVEPLEGIDLIRASDYHATYQVGAIFDGLGDDIGCIPYVPEYYCFLATLIVRRYYSIKEPPCKVIVLDCDNTLWDGVCGEVGPENVRIDAIRERFQRFLAGKAKEGTLLCLCSKSNEEDVWNVFAQNRSMVLTREDIVDSRINWERKSENVRAMAGALNLGLDSFLFIDDNPVECADARIGCP